MELLQASEEVMAFSKSFFKMLDIFFSIMLEGTVRDLYRVATQIGITSIFIWVSIVFYNSISEIWHTNWFPLIRQNGQLYELSIIISGDTNKSKLSRLSGYFQKTKSVQIL